MANLHEMMPKYARSQAWIDAALGNGDAATIAKETGYLLSTTAGSTTGGSMMGR